MKDIIIVSLKIMRVRNGFVMMILKYMKYILKIL